MCKKEIPKHLYFMVFIQILHTISKKKTVSLYCTEIFPSALPHDTPTRFGLFGFIGANCSYKTN